MNGYALGILISLLIYIVIGNWAGRKVKDVDDFLVAGRQAPTLLIVGTLVASAVSTSSFLGDSGFAYSGYVPAMIFQLPTTVLGYVAGSMFFGRYIRRAKSLTVAEFFGRRFSSRRVRVFAAFTVIVGLGGYLMTVTQGAALVISQVTGFSYVQALLAVWFGYSAFTFYAGSRGVVITDTIMFMLFTVVAFLALAYIVDAGGGWFESVHKLANLEARPGIIGTEGYMGPGAVWKTATEMWTWSAIIGVSWGIVFAISPWQSSRYLMARDEHVIIRSGLITAIVLSLIWAVLEFAGGAIAISNPDIKPIAQAMIWAALNLMPVVVGSLLLTGIVAAALSSASTFLTLVGFAITNDIQVDESQSDASRLRLSRITIIGVGVAALVVALSVPPSIFWITYFIGPLFAASWGPIAFMSVWSSRVTEAGAFWGMFGGFLVCVVTKSLVMLEIIWLPVILDPLVLGALASLSLIIIVSGFGEVREEEREFRQALHVAPPELHDEVQNRRTRIWPKLLMIWGALSSVGLIILYVRPYQLATGLTGDGGPYVVWSGELIAALYYGLMLSLGGLAAHLALKRFLRTD
jgi:sodium/pantothenate symporter